MYSTQVQYQIRRVSPMESDRYWVLADSFRRLRIRILEPSYSWHGPLEKTAPAADYFLKKYTNDLYKLQHPIKTESRYPSIVDTKGQKKTTGGHPHTRTTKHSLKNSVMVQIVITVYEILRQMKKKVSSHEEKNFQHL